MSLDWLDSPEHNVIIVLFFEFVLKCFISFIHLNELLVSLLIINIFLRVILESLLPIGIFYLLKSSCSGNSQNSVVCIEARWIVCLEKLFFCFINDAMLIEELVEGILSITKGILFDEDVVIVGSFIGIGKNLKGFTNQMKLIFKMFSVVLVLIRMILGSQLFIGLFYLKQRGICRYSKYLVIVFDHIFRGHEQDLLKRYNYNDALIIGVYIEEILFQIF